VVTPKRGQIILVGGGDPYLASRSRSDYPKRATITGLARATASRLKHDKIKKVTLGYDASLFRGPSWNPRWPGFYADQVSHTSALWVDEGRVGFGGVRYKNPAKHAATAFADALAKQGIRVTSTQSARAPKTAAPVAKVSSMPLERIVEHLLMVSDNDAAEVIFRQAAIGAKKPGSIAEATKVVRSELTELGIWDPGMTLTDGSGLARQTKVPADSMVKMLRVAASTQHPELRAVITGLSVAGGGGQSATPVLRRQERGRPRCGTRQDRDPQQGPRARRRGAYHRRVAAGVRLLDQQAEERVQRHDLAGSGDCRVEYLRVSLTPSREAFLRTRPQMPAKSAKSATTCGLVRRNASIWRGLR
jgi:hypothetical protein